MTKKLFKIFREIVVAISRKKFFHSNFFYNSNYYTNNTTNRSGVNEEVHVDEFDTEDEALFGASDNLIEEETDTDLLEELDIYGCVVFFSSSIFSHFIYFFPIPQFRALRNYFFSNSFLNTLKP